jgi:hypothetical protein
LQNSSSCCSKIFLHSIWTDDHHRVLDVAKIDFDVADVNF